MTNERFSWHLSIPVCRTYKGSRIHLSHISWKDLQGLCQKLNCDATQIERCFFDKVKAKLGRA